MMRTDRANPCAQALFLVAFFLLTGFVTQGPPPRAVNATRFVHDPCIIREGEWYYVFSTGHGIPVRRSRDLAHWETAGRVFAEDLPAWAKAEVPGSVFPWAPDIVRLNGRYYLYYSVSSFGRNRSVIGLATSETLDSRRPGYGWRDEGKVFESQRTDNFNAIDSNVIRTGDDGLALTFGSFWSGIQLLRANATGGKPAPGASVRGIARRAAPGAIEAPFVVRRGKYHYLFVSFDLCCRGVNSTYNIRVGRAKKVEGPYVDREGRALLEGGGTAVLATEGRFIGPGHCAVLREKTRDLLVCHFYDGEANGVPTLMVRELEWDRAGWPRAGKMICPAGEALRVGR